MNYSLFSSMLSLIQKAITSVFPFRERDWERRDWVSNKDWKRERKHINNSLEIKKLCGLFSWLDHSITNWSCCCASCSPAKCQWQYLKNILFIYIFYSKLTVSRSLYLFIILFVPWEQIVISCLHVQPSLFSLFIICWLGEKERCYIMYDGRHL